MHMPVNFLDLSTPNVMAVRPPVVDHTLLAKHPAVLKYIKKLKRDRFKSSMDSARETAKVLLQVVQKTSFRNQKELLRKIKQNGLRLIEARPLNITVGNAVRRVLAIIRMAFTEHIHGKVLTDFDEGSMLDIFSRSGQEDQPESITKKQETNVRRIIEVMIGEYIDEVSNSYDLVCMPAREILHGNDVVFTYGRSKTVRSFIDNASKFRKLKLYVPEGAPDFRGQEMAASLSNLPNARNIQTIVINDASIFTLMPRANKVIIGCFNVMSNGGILGPSGLHSFCLTAKHFSIPVIVVVGVYKISPLLAFDQTSYNQMRDPEEILSYDDPDIIDKVDVVNPAYDYVPPDLIDLHITNFGGHSPSFIYRVLKQYYHPDDHDLTTTFNDTAPPWFTPKVKPMEPGNGFGFANNQPRI